MGEKSRGNWALGGTLTDEEFMAMFEKTFKPDKEDECEDNAQSAEQ